MTRRYRTHYHCASDGIWSDDVSPWAFGYSMSFQSTREEGQHLTTAYASLTLEEALICFDDCYADETEVPEILIAVQAKEVD